jgi:hypothetical protein
MIYNEELGRLYGLSIVGCKQEGGVPVICALLFRDSLFQRRNVERGKIRKKEREVKHRDAKQVIVC